MSDETPADPPIRMHVVALPYLTWRKCELCATQVPLDGSTAYERRPRCQTHPPTEAEIAADERFR